MNKYYLTINGEAAGPYLLEQLRNMWAAGQITVDTPVCLEGASGWSTIESMLPILDTKAVSSTTSWGVAKAPVKSYPEVEKSDKSRGIYIVLGLFFGQLGVHNFYAGRYSVGVAQLVLTLAAGAVFMGFETGIMTLLAVPAWVIFDLFTVDSDGENLEMKM